MGIDCQNTQPVQAPARRDNHLHSASRGEGDVVSLGRTYGPALHAASFYTLPWSVWMTSKTDRRSSPAHGGVAERGSCGRAFDRQHRAFGDPVIGPAESVRTIGAALIALLAAAVSMYSHEP